jgi:hypothetical protein
MNGGMKIKIRWRTHEVYNESLWGISIAEFSKCSEIYELNAPRVGKPVFRER